MDINLSSQIVVQTAAQWAVDATVYSAKRILVTSDAYYGSTDQRKFKIADGVQTWSNLDYVPIAQTLAQVVANGDTLNGLLAQSNDTFSKLYVEDGDIDVYYNNGVKLARIVASALSLELTQTDLIKLSAPTINLPQATASRIVETDASKNLTYVAKGTAYNKNFGVSSGDILMLGSTSVASQILATDANNQVQTLATAIYPSLTELSYVKGLTSAVQTQFSDIRRSYQIITGTLAPADSTTYYSNATSDTSANWSTNIAVYQSQIPITGTIKECSIIVFNNNSPTSEASTLILRNLTTSTDYTLSNGVTFDSTNGVWKPLTIITGLNISISAGNNFVLKLTTPAWSTNPTSIRIAVNLSISL